jgi:flagellar protein FliO/FliZ
MRLFSLAVCWALLLPVTLNAQAQAQANDAAPVTEVASANNTTEIPVASADTPTDTRADTALAKSDNTAPRPSAGLGLGKMALSLAIVVAIVLALGWTFKKLTLRLPGSRHIKIISTMPLGPKERLLVIEIQGKQRVLGVTSQSINLLFELENSLPEEKLASDFHTQLQSFLKK